MRGPIARSSRSFPRAFTALSQILSLPSCSAAINGSTALNITSRCRRHPLPDRGPRAFEIKTGGLVLAYQTGGDTHGFGFGEKAFLDLGLQGAGLHRKGGRLGRPERIAAERE